jgi:hypothetical protein
MAETIADIPSDILIHIAHHLPYAKCLLLIQLFSDVKPSEKVFKWLFANCNLFHNTPGIHNALKQFNMTPEHLYHVTKNQCFNFHQVQQLLYDVARDKVTTKNKLDYALTYDSKFVTPIKINNTIRLSQIMLTVVDYNTEDPKRLINNPYNYIQIYVNDILIMYLIEVVTRKFIITRDVYHHTQHFRFVMYANYWYKSNINIYVMFCLYLCNLGVIYRQHREVIMHLATTMPSIGRGQVINDFTLTFIFQFMELFTVGKWLATLFHMFIKYISENQLTEKLKNDTYATKSCIYIHKEILNEDDISIDIKDMVTSGLAEIGLDNSRL